MKIKKFKADSLKEGKTRVAKELGEDAVILSSRTAKSPSGKDYIEIVAALDESPVSSEGTRALPHRNEPEAPEDKLSGKDFIDAAGQVFSEINSLRDILDEISDNVRYKYSGVLGETFGRLFKALRKADISEPLALNIVGRITSKNKDADFIKAIELAREELMSGLEFLPPLTLPDQRRVIAFVGPTGSGKTLTLVKLAVVSKLVLKADVFIISADTRKVGGSEQLQTFASIAGIPYQAVYSTEDFENIYARESGRDLIFLDTIGCSQKDPAALEEVESYLEAAGPDLIYLVQSAIAGKMTMAQVLKNFLRLNPSGLVLTHFDETATFGAIAEVLQKYPLPLAYFTNGQKIPEDIEPARKETLSELILPDIKKKTE